MFMDLLGNLDMLHHWRDFLDGLFPNTDWSGIRHPVLRLRASVVQLYILEPLSNGDHPKPMRGVA
jgi:hypothetical protein